ncbi:MAG: class II aldolase/adducin family protein [Candidatus Schekmanbacteria bacterium]|nr:class II aldolase/adducin family protein [Candidatus Schekmanbacteria bacterium]
MTLMGGTSEIALRRAIVDAGRKLYQRGLIAASDGNISALLEGPDRHGGAGRVLVTPSAVWKGEMTPDMLLVVDFTGKRLKGDRAATSELPMHLAVYRCRPDVRAVVHAHPPLATAYAVAHTHLGEPLLSEVVLRLGAIERVAYNAPSTEQLATSVAASVADHDVLLLANHGALTVGHDLPDALGRMETLEHFATISLAVRQLGGGIRLSDSQVAELRALASAGRFAADQPQPWSPPGQPCTTCDVWRQAVTAKVASEVVKQLAKANIP